MGQAHGKFSFEGEPRMSRFEKNIYVGRIIESERAFGSVVRDKRRPLSSAADVLCWGQFPERGRGT